MATNSLIKASQNSETGERAKNVLNIKNTLKHINLNTWLDIEKLQLNIKKVNLKTVLKKNVKLP